MMNAEAERRDGFHARTIGDEDDLEREGSGEYDEDYDPLNAESPEIGNLSKTKLTDKDYIARAHSAKTRKGKYGVTVPKPFGFDTRDARKSVTIREKKVEEMVNEKRLEEDMVIKYQFRSKPIPPEVLIPRYNSIIEAEQARRNAVRSQSV
jgi:hypothetical protein